VGTLKERPPKYLYRMQGNLTQGSILSSVTLEFKKFHRLFLQQLQDLGERHKLPQEGPGTAPAKTKLFSMI